MAYACPVCGVPQADGEHLADHVALTAVLHGGPHAAWLDEHVPDWERKAPDALGAALVEHAEGTEHETEQKGAVEAFEHVPRGVVDAEELDPEARRAVERAREMTRSRRAAEDSEE